MSLLTSLGLRALYELVHLSYSVLVFFSYLVSLFNTPVERRALLHCCLHPLSQRQPPSHATPSAFTPSASLVSSSLPPFPSFNKHPAHLAFAFPSTAVHYPLLPYLVLWALQSGAHSLTLHSPSSVWLQCVPQLASSLAGTSRREEGAALHSVEVIIRTKRRLRVHEVQRWPDGDRQRVLGVVGRGQLPTVSEVWSVNGGRCWKHDSQQLVFNDEQRETSSRVSRAKISAGKQADKMDEAAEEETKEATDRTSSGAKRRINGANGAAPHSRTNGHSASVQQPTSTHSSTNPFIVTLLAAEHTWDDIVNSTYDIALPAQSSSSTVPFPSPDEPVPPSAVLRCHVLATAFPLYAIDEPNLLLVFSSPLSLLSFPPWLQRLCELDNRPARHAAVWTRREFEQVIERYSTTVQRGGA